MSCTATSCRNEATESVKSSCAAVSNILVNTDSSLKCFLLYLKQVFKRIGILSAENGSTCPEWFCQEKYLGLTKFEFSFIRDQYGANFIGLFTKDFFSLHKILSKF